MTTPAFPETNYLKLSGISHVLSIPRGLGLPVAGLPRQILVSIGGGGSELEPSWRFAARPPLPSRDEPPSRRPDPLLPPSAMPGPATVVARHGCQVLATMRVVPDAPPSGLPLEAAYAVEIRGLRARGLRLAELTGVAACGLTVGEFVAVFRTLLRMGLGLHALHGGDAAVILAPPRHRAFYREILGGEPLGPRWPLAVAGAGGRPAEAWVLHTGRIKTGAPGRARGC